MRRYNKETAIELTELFEEQTGFNVKDNSRKLKTILLRTILYKVLIDKNYMNDRQVSEFLEEVYGVFRNRSSIFCSLAKVDLYYNQIKDFRDAYDLFFDDKKKPVNPNVISDEQKNDLYSLINRIPKDKVEDIRQLLELRLKSYSWKSQDKCEVIESY